VPRLFGQRAHRAVDRMSRGTTHRTLRVEDDLWSAAKSVADDRSENLSEVLRQALRDYVSRSVDAAGMPRVNE